MKYRLTLIGLIVALCCLALTASVGAQEKSNEQKLSPQDLRHELEPVLASYYEAVDKRDLERLKSFQTEDCRLRLPDGKILFLSELRKALAGGNENIRDNQENFLIEKIKGNSQQAVAELKINQTYRQKLVDGNYVDVRLSRKERQTWQKTSGGWKLNLIEASGFKSTKTLNGKKVDDIRLLPGSPIPPVIPNDEDKPVLESGKAIVFIYLFNSALLLKLPVYCNDQELARMTGHTYVKIKLDPGRYRFRSEKGEPIELALESRKIYFLWLDFVAGFPKGQAVLKTGDGMVSPQAYKLPATLNLKPLKPENIKDSSKAYTN